MKSAFYFFIAMVFAGTVSAADLVPESRVRLMMVNGEVTESDTKPVAIEPGYVQAVVKVFMTIGRGPESTSFESEPFLLMFEAGEQAISVIAPKFKDLARAKRHFKGEPDIKLVSAGKVLKHQYARLEGKPGFLPYSDLEGIVTEYNQKHGIALAGQAKPEAAAHECEGVADYAVLKSCYLKASEADQQAFKSWLAEQ